MQGASVDRFELGIKRARDKKGRDQTRVSAPRSEARLLRARPFSHLVDFQLPGRPSQAMRLNVTQKLTF